MVMKIGEMTVDQVKSEIIRRIDEARLFTEGWHNNIKKWRRLYDGDHYTSAAKEYENRYVDPTFKNTVDLTVGIFQANRMIWRATCWTPSPTKDERTSDIEKYLTGVLDASNDRHEMNLEYEVNLHFARDGGAVLRSIWDPTIAAYSRRPSQQIDLQGEQLIPSTMYAESPVDTMVIDPLNILLLPGGIKRWAAVIQSEQRSVWEIEQEFGIELEKYAKLDLADKMRTKGNFYDYWQIGLEDGQILVRNATLFENEFVVRDGDDPTDPLRVMPGYTDIPITIAFFKPSQRDNSKSWEGIIGPMEETVLALERAVNRSERQITLFTGLPMFANLRNSRRTLRMDEGLGKIHTLGQGEGISFPVWPGNPPDVYNHMEFMSRRIQQSGFTDAMFGETADASGYALAQMADQNRIKLVQPIAHLENLWTWWARKVLDLTVNFAGDSAIQVYGENRGQRFTANILGKNLSGYSVTCTIKPEYPNEKIRKHAMATQVAGILSLSTIMENYLDIQQPSDEMDRKLMEEILNSPEAKQYAMMEVLTDWTKSGNQVAARLLSMMEQAGIAGKGGRPEEPTNAMAPTGLQSQNGQASMQAQGRIPGQGEADQLRQQSNAAPNMQGVV